MKVLGMIWLHHEGNNFLGTKRIDLLRKIDEYGSLSRAAQVLGLPYKSAWDMLEKMNLISPQPLIATVRGGKEKGGTQLTPFAYALLKTVAQIEQEHQLYLAQLNQKLSEFEHQILQTPSEK